MWGYVILCEQTVNIHTYFYEGGKYWELKIRNNKNHKDAAPTIAFRIRFQL